MKLKLTPRQLEIFKSILREQGWTYSEQVEALCLGNKRIATYFPSGGDYRFTAHRYL